MSFIRIKNRRISSVFSHSLGRDESAAERPPRAPAGHDRPIGYSNWLLVSGHSLRALVLTRQPIRTLRMPRFISHHFGLLDC